MSYFNQNAKHQKAQLIKISFFLAAFSGLIYILFAIDNLLLSFILSLVIYYVLTPIINLSERSGLKRSYSTIIVFTLLTILIFGFLYSFLPRLSVQFTKLNLEIPRYIDGITSFLVEIENFLETTTGAFFNINLSSRVENLMTNWTASLFKDIPSFISQSLTLLFLAPFLSFFLIKDGSELSRKILSFVPNNIFELCLNLEYQINEQMGQFIRARILEAVFVGGIVWLGLAAINFPFAIFLAIFAGLVNLIPYVGPLVSPFPALVVAFINEYDPSTFVIIISIYGIAQILDIIFIIPLVVAKIVNLHPITVVLSIIIGAQTMGVLGMIISIPVVSASKVIFSNIQNHIFHFHR